MRQLRCIATYSHRLWRPKTSAILNRRTQLHDTFNWWQSFVLTEFMPESINNYDYAPPIYRGARWINILTQSASIPGGETDFVVSRG